MRLNLAAMSTSAVVATLQDDLQIAIQLEQATLPPYLYAYWSINSSATSPGAKAAQQSILTVINEEMIHLAIVCNILNATGGQPSLNGSKDKYPVPTYPGPLPAHSKTTNPFEVGLGPLGPSTLQTFLEIELPQYDDPIPQAPTDGWATIGEFYEEIIALIKTLSDSDFTSTSNGQATDAPNSPTPPGSGTILTVNSKLSAIAALTEVIVQGEGTKTDPESEPGEAAHYFQFKQVLQSIQRADSPWNYQQDVVNLVVNPNAAAYPATAVEPNRQFNATFSALLDGLHNAFNSSSPDNNLSAAFTSMVLLKGLAKKVMQIPLSNEQPLVYCGPTFQYIPAGQRTNIAAAGA